MKIGLCGAPCTGKTTLAKAVAEKLGLTFIGESFEGAQAQCLMHDCKVNTLNDPWPKYFEKVWNDTNNYYDEIVGFTKGLAWDLEEKERLTGDNFITDSASPSQAAAGLIYNTFIEDTQQLMEWYNYQIERAKNYDHIFFIPYNRNIQMEDDNRRPVNKALQKQFDLIIPSILTCDVYEGFDIQWESIIEESIEDRVRVICNLTSGELSV